MPDTVGLNRGEVGAESVLGIAPGVVSREVDGELVVVVPKRGKFVVLNATGLLVFRMVDGVRTVKDIAESLSREHGIRFEQALEDVQTFVEEMLDTAVFSIKTL